MACYNSHIPENPCMVYIHLHLADFTRKMVVPFGMVPLIINPMYTLYSGYLLGISPFKGLHQGGVKTARGPHPKGFPTIFPMMMSMVNVGRYIYQSHGCYGYNSLVFCDPIEPATKPHTTRNMKPSKTQKHNQQSYKVGPKNHL